MVQYLSTSILAAELKTFGIQMDSADRRLWRLYRGLAAGVGRGPSVAFPAKNGHHFYIEAGKNGSIMMYKDI